MLNVRILTNVSGAQLLNLHWNEPEVVESSRSRVVDYYLLTINQVNINTTETTIDVAIQPDMNNITVTLKAANCHGFTPLTTLNLHQTKGNLNYCLSQEIVRPMLSFYSTN